MADADVIGGGGLAGLVAAAEIADAGRRALVVDRDRETANPFCEDAQVMGIHNARRSLGDRLSRTAKPRARLEPARGPPIAVRLDILIRKTLGGFETDLDGRVFGQDGAILPGLYAAARAA